MGKLHRMGIRVAVVVDATCEADGTFFHKIRCGVRVLRSAFRAPLALRQCVVVRLTL
jgi:hypothetical protein